MTDQEIESLIKKIVEDRLEAKAREEAAQKSEARRRILNAAGYAAGSVALFAAAWAAIPNLLSNVSGALYKASLKKANHDDDDWGPVIERKEAPAKPEQPDRSVITVEEQPDGD